MFLEIFVLKYPKSETLLVLLAEAKLFALSYFSISDRLKMYTYLLLEF